MTLILILKWAAAIGGVIAALVISLDIGRRVTGWGFALFVASNFAWIAGALLSKDAALLTQNLFLLAIDIFGVYRYLIRRKPPHYA
jgi:nicotinamide riboside transporter PnuC